eukprot:1160205-Pelagomonas_calceolata.AAC.4
MPYAGNWEGQNTDAGSWRQHKVRHCSCDPLCIDVAQSMVRRAWLHSVRCGTAVVIHCASMLHRDNARCGTAVLIHYASMLHRAWCTKHGCTAAWLPRARCSTAVLIYCALMLHRSSARCGTAVVINVAQIEREVRQCTVTIHNPRCTGVEQAKHGAQCVIGVMVGYKQWWCKDGWAIRMGGL